MKKIFIKFIIYNILILNIFLFYKFSTVITPVKIIDIESQIIQKIIFTFNISYDIAKTFYAYGKLKNIDPILLISIAVIESNNNPNAVSSKGYKGRMQSTREKLPDNIEILNGAEDFLEFLKYAKGDLKKALAMYNGGRNPPKSSYQYAEKVLHVYSKAKNKIYFQINKNI